LIVLPITNVAISHAKTPYWNIFEYGSAEKEILSLLDSIDPNGKFVFVSNLPSTYSKTAPAYYYAYATVYKNLSTPQGYYYHIASSDYLRGINKIKEETNCENIENILLDYNTTYVIAYENKCELLKNCEFKIIKENNKSCLYKL